MIVDKRTWPRPERACFLEGCDWEVKNSYRSNSYLTLYIVTPSLS